MHFRVALFHCSSTVIFCTFDKMLWYSNECNPSTCFALNVKRNSCFCLLLYFPTFFNLAIHVVAFFTFDRQPLQSIPQQTYFLPLDVTSWQLWFCCRPLLQSNSKINLHPSSIRNNRRPPNHESFALTPGQSSN